MMTNSNIYILYRFSEEKSEGLDLSSSKYRVIFLFNDRGLIEKVNFKKICEEYSISIESNSIDFHTKEELLGFAHSLGVYMNSELALLLSVNDFNIGIESCHDLQAFKEIFNRYGTSLPCRDTQSSDKSIFSKFF
jgi:hypothetical protein